jgi:hypothetical protein
LAEVQLYTIFRLFLFLDEKSLSSDVISGSPFSIMKIGGFGRQKETLIRSQNLELEIEWSQSKKLKLCIAGGAMKVA